MTPLEEEEYYDEAFENFCTKADEEYEDYRMRIQEEGEDINTKHENL